MVQIVKKVYIFIPELKSTVIKVNFPNLIANSFNIPYIFAESKLLTGKTAEQSNYYYPWLKDPIFSRPTKVVRSHIKTNFCWENLALQSEKCFVVNFLGTQNSSLESGLLLSDRLFNDICYLSENKTIPIGSVSNPKKVPNLKNYFWNINDFSNQELDYFKSEIFDESLIYPVLKEISKLVSLTTTFLEVSNTKSYDHLFIRIDLFENIIALGSIIGERLIKSLEKIIINFLSEIIQNKNFLDIHLFHGDEKCIVSSNSQIVDDMNDIDLVYRKLFKRDVGENHKPSFSCNEFVAERVERNLYVQPEVQKEDVCELRKLEQENFLRLANNLIANGKSYELTRIIQTNRNISVQTKVHLIAKLSNNQNKSNSQP